MRPTANRIKELFLYDPLSGIVTRRCDYGKSPKGFVFTSLTVLVDNFNVAVSHIAWITYHGDWPPDGYWIDHKDRVKGNNRITNLRLATPTQNQQNKAGSGQYAKGVTWRDRYMNPWQAKIRVDGTRIHLGSFATEDEAAKAYQEACLKYHGEFACPK